jgi:hypothetical protein
MPMFGKSNCSPTLGQTFSHFLTVIAGRKSGENFTGGKLGKLICFQRFIAPSPERSNAGQRPSRFGTMGTGIEANGQPNRKLALGQTPRRSIQIAECPPGAGARPGPPESGWPEWRWPWPQERSKVHRKNWDERAHRARRTPGDRAGSGDTFRR